MFSKHWILPGAYSIQTVLELAYWQPLQQSSLTSLERERKRNDRNANIIIVTNLQRIVWRVGNQNDFFMRKST